MDTHDHISSAQHTSHEGQVKVEVFSLYYMEWNILKHGSGLVQVPAGTWTQAGCPDSAKDEIGSTIVLCATNSNNWSHIFLWKKKQFFSNSLECNHVLLDERKKNEIGDGDRWAVIRWRHYGLSCCLLMCRERKNIHPNLEVWCGAQETQRRRHQQGSLSSCRMVRPTNLSPSSLLLASSCSPCIRRASSPPPCRRIPSSPLPAQRNSGNNNILNQRQRLALLPHKFWFLSLPQPPLPLRGIARYAIHLSVSIST